MSESVEIPPWLPDRIALTDSGCWEWLAQLDPCGYSKVYIEGGYKTGHRSAYIALVGPVPTGLELDHLCRNRACVNPEHLEPVTHAENMRRAAAAVTQCRSGHEYTPENTRIRSGARQCRACDRRRSRESSERRARSLVEDAA